MLPSSTNRAPSSLLTSRTSACPWKLAAALPTIENTRPSRADQLRASARTKRVGALFASAESTTHDSDWAESVPASSLILIGTKLYNVVSRNPSGILGAPGCQASTNAKVRTSLPRPRIGTSHGSLFRPSATLLVRSMEPRPTHVRWISGSGRLRSKPRRAFSRCPFFRPFSIGCVRHRA